MIWVPNTALHLAVEVIGYLPGRTGIHHFRDLGSYTWCFTCPSLRRVILTDGLLLQNHLDTVASFGSGGQEVLLYIKPSNGRFRLQLNSYENSDLNIMIASTMGQVVYNTNINVLVLS